MIQAALPLFEGLEYCAEDYTSNLTLVSPLKIGLWLVKKIIEIIMKKAGAGLKAIKRLGPTE
jgi:hypothetical protein